MKKLLFSAMAISFAFSHCMEENNTPRKKEFLATQKILGMVNTYIENNQGKTSFELKNQIVETPYLGPYSPGTAQGLILRNLTCMSHSENYDRYSLHTPWGVIPLISSNEWASLAKETLFPTSVFKKFGHKPIGVAGGRTGSDEHYNFTDEHKFEVVKVDSVQLPNAIEDETRVSIELFKEYQQLKLDMLKTS